MRPRRRVVEEGGQGEDDEEKDLEDPNEELGDAHHMLQERTAKEEVIGHLLARWWYALPEWPPRDFDFEAELERQKLKRASIDEWEFADDFDPSDGRKKVYEITHFPGIFRDAQGNAIDLRPLTGRPCYRELAKWSERELREKLKVALTNQLADLNHSPYHNTDNKCIDRLRQELLRLLQAYRPP